VSADLQFDGAIASQNALSRYWEIIAFHLISLESFPISSLTAAATVSQYSFNKRDFSSSIASAMAQAASKLLPDCSTVEMMGLRDFVWVNREA
jgi:hypothetical protein